MVCWQVFSTQRADVGLDIADWYDARNVAFNPVWQGRVAVPGINRRICLPQQEHVTQMIIRKYYEYVGEANGRQFERQKCECECCSKSMRMWYVAGTAKLITPLEIQEKQCWAIRWKPQEQRKDGKRVRKRLGIPRLHIFSPTVEHHLPIIYYMWDTIGHQGHKALPEDVMWSSSPITLGGLSCTQPTWDWLSWTPDLI